MPDFDAEQVSDQLRDIAEVPAVEVITTTAIHLMSAAAVQCGLGEDGHKADLDEARKLINALAGLITSAAADLASTRLPRGFGYSGCARSGTRREVHGASELISSLA